eukprot:gene3451-6087_t
MEDVVLYLLSWLGTVILALFCILCLVINDDGPRNYAFLQSYCVILYLQAAGLFFLAEFVEENTVLTKKILQKILIVVVVIQLLVGIFTSIPLWPCTVLGIVAHGLYSKLLVTFPYFDLSSPKFILSAIFLVLHHYFVFSHFTYQYYSFDQVVAYFTICVWLIPFILFISLSANEYTLPTSSEVPEEVVDYLVFYIAFYVSITYVLMCMCITSKPHNSNAYAIALLQWIREKLEDLSWN